MLEPPELVDLINSNNVVQKYLPKQTDIEKIVKIIQRKVVKGTHLHVTIKEIQGGYLNSPYFKTYICTLYKTNCPVQRVLYAKLRY